MGRTWFITGANRGLGNAIAKRALENGDNVVATARDLSKLQQVFELSENILLASLDVQSEAQSQKAIQMALDKFGKIDVLVNNAGFGQLGHFETVPTEAIQNQFNTNVFGLMNVTRAALPSMRTQQSGHIFNFSSIGGTLGFDGASIYCATKFAVEGFSESLSLEVQRFGIDVTIVEPGFFRTDFLDSSSVKYGEKVMDDYGDAVSEQRSEYDNYSHAQPGSPEKLAALIVGVVNEGLSPKRLVVGSDALEMSRNLLKSRKEELELWSSRSIQSDY